MDKPEVATFNKTLVSMYEMKGPVSKQKISEITKAAMNAIHYFKHVVLIVEKFICKCKPEYKLWGFYVIDSIIRKGKTQYKNKDVFGPRFAANLSTTLENALSCPPEDKLKIVRVLNLWLSHGIYDEATIDPLLQFCRANGLDVNVESVEMKVKGKVDMSIYQKKEEGRHSQVPAPRTPPISSQLQPQTPPNEISDQAGQNELSEREVLQLLARAHMDWEGIFSKNVALLRRAQNVINRAIVEKIEIDSRRQGNIKNLLSRDYDYSDEESDEDAKKPKEPIIYNKEQLYSIAENLVRDENIRNELQQIYNEVARTHPNLSVGYGMHMSAHQTHMQSRPKTPPMPMQFNVPPPSITNGSQVQYAQMVGQGFPNLPPPGMGMPPQPQADFTRPPPNLLAGAFTFAAEQPPGVGPEPNLNDETRSSRGKKRERSLSRSRDRDDKKRRDNERDRERDRDRDRDDRRRSGRDDRDRRRSHSRDRDREKDRDRRDRDRTDRDRDRNERSERSRKRSDGSPRRDDAPTNKEKERERRRLGLPQRPKENHVLLASRTIWMGRVPQNASEEDIKAAIAEAGVPERVNIIAPRACAYVTMPDRRSAFKIIDRLAKDVKIHNKSIKVSWATGQGLKNDEKLMDYWDVDRGISQIPHIRITVENLEPLLDGSYLDVDTLPAHLKGLYNEKGLINKPSFPPQANQGQMSFPSMPLPDRAIINLAGNIGQPTTPLAGQQALMQNQQFFTPMAAMPAAFIMPQGLPTAIFAAATTPNTGPTASQAFGNMFTTMQANPNQEGLSGLFSQQSFKSGEQSFNSRGGFPGGRGGDRGRGNFRGARGRAGFDNRGGRGGGSDRRSRFGDRLSTDSPDNESFGNTGFGNQGFSDRGGRGKGRFGFDNRGGRGRGGFDRDRSGFDRDRGGFDRDRGGFDRDDRSRGRGGRGQGRGGRGGQWEDRGDRRRSYGERDEDRRSFKDDLRDQIQSMFETGGGNDPTNAGDQEERAGREDTYNDMRDQIQKMFETGGAMDDSFGDFSGQTQEQRHEDSHDREEQASAALANSAVDRGDDADFFNSSVSTSAKHSQESSEQLPQTSTGSFEHPEVSSTTFNDEPSTFEAADQSFGMEFEEKKHEESQDVEI